MEFKGSQSRNLQNGPLSKVVLTCEKQVTENHEATVHNDKTHMSKSNNLQMPHFNYLAMLLEYSQMINDSSRNHFSDIVPSKSECFAPY